MPKPSRPLPAFTPQQIARFWSKVAKAGVNECWPWTACTTGKYGSFAVTHRQCVGAHRVAHFLASGRDPHPLLVLHSCDNPPCCNPAHLREGNFRDNAQDAMRRGRMATGERTGAYTHPESRPRGATHGSRTHPERVPRGDTHYSRLHPERMARGERHGSRTHPELVRRGEKASAAKLTAADVVTIRQRHADGETQQALAKEYGVVRNNISNIVNRRSWKHV